MMLTLAVTFPVLAQVSIEDILVEIEKNNKTLQANAQNTEAQKLAFKSNNPLYNPNVEYDFMYGFPVNAGNQTDFLVNQTFDFPTSYGKRKQLSEGRISQTDFQLNASRQSLPRNLLRNESVRQAKTPDQTVMQKHLPCLK